MITILFYDFEVFKYNWLIKAIDMDKQKIITIWDSQEQMEQLCSEYGQDVWVGYNSKFYDQYIKKAILCGFDPKKVNDYIIEKGNPGYKFSSLFRKFNFIEYDVLVAEKGLKLLEGFLGNNIHECEIPFDIDRPLTDEEKAIVERYCEDDVMNTIEVFMQKISDFNAMFSIVKKFNLPLQDIGMSEAKITAKVLGCQRKDFDDEFDYYFLPCLEIKKYKQVVDWFAQFQGKKFKNESDKKSFYKSTSLTVIVAGVPHTFGFGGCHGAPDEPIHEKGALYHVDVNNYYPSELLAWGLVTRAATNDNYALTYKIRKELKDKQLSAKTKEESKQYKVAQLPYKKMLNALSGGMKDVKSPAYDPRNNNIMCINGQLMLLDLIEHLEVIPGFKLIQSNTDGLIVKIPDTDAAFEMLDDICWEWEQRCSTDKCEIGLALDLISEIYQKDVNNYLWIEADGSVGERKGAYVKELSSLDYDLPIVNKALVERMAHGIPVEKTINDCDQLKEFQMIRKISAKYKHIIHGGHWETYKAINPATGRMKTFKKFVGKQTVLNEKCIRVFASKNISDGGLKKVHSITGRSEKIEDTPEHSFIYNDDVNDVKCPSYLDKKFYIDMANKRLKYFGVI